ncbi:MAG: hypothetical protein HFI68_01880 [Lachnospiraceae bacterium]|nr:hypothetical protein [Lachnospiraceae bacterium]
MKKRIAAFVLVMAMVVLALAGCGGKDSSAPVVGKWKLTSIEAAGMTMSVDEFLSMSGMSDTTNEMEIKSNGKFSMEMVGEKGTGKWEWKEPICTLTDEAGDSVEAEYKDGKLSMDLEGVLMIFEKK